MTRDLLALVLLQEVAGTLDRQRRRGVADRVALDQGGDDAGTVGGR